MAEQVEQLQGLSRWWFLTYFWKFHPQKIGEDFQFDYIIFFHMGWFNHQAVVNLSNFTASSELLKITRSIPITRCEDP